MQETVASDLRKQLFEVLGGGGEMMKTLAFVENMSGQGVAHLSCQLKFRWSDPNWQGSP